MVRYDYSRSQFDSCVYFKKLVDDSFIHLLLYVDDMLIVAKNMSEINKLKNELSGEFEMKNLGAAKKILSKEVQRNRTTGISCLTHKSYINKVLERFGMKNAKFVIILLGAHFLLSAALSPQLEKDIEYMLYVPYSNAVGSVMYAMVYTRSDI